MKSKPSIRAITFDVGGTLIEPWPSVGHVYAEVASRHGMKACPELLNRNFAAAWKAKGDFRHTKSDWAELVQKTFAGLSGPPPKVFFNELYTRFAQPDAWRVFDDVLPALELLAKRRMRLAVISNWDERLRILLPALKLERFFEAIVVSCEVGRTKPSPLIFKRAAEILGVSPEEILHVGDSFEEDITGGERAGFKAIWLRRNDIAASRSQSVTSLKGLLEFME